MRILILGASGLVGGDLMRIAGSSGHEALGTYFQTRISGLEWFSLEQPGEYSEIHKRFQPDAVVLSAAMVWADGCERQALKAWQINTHAPIAIGREALALGARVAFVSSNYVFDGTAGPYDEEAPTNPVNIYGRTKLETENALFQTDSKRVLAIRTCGIYGEEVNGKNYLYQVVRNLRTGRPMRIASDQLANATDATDLAWGIIRLLESGASGIYNLAGPDPMLSRVDFAIQVARLYQLDTDLIIPTPTAELSQLAERPLVAGLINSKAAREIGYTPTDKFLLHSLQP